MASLTDAAGWPTLRRTRCQRACFYRSVTPDFLTLSVPLLNGCEARIADDTYGADRRRTPAYSPPDRLRLVRGFAANHIYDMLNSERCETDEAKRTNGVRPEINNIRHLLRIYQIDGRERLTATRHPASRPALVAGLPRHLRFLVPSLRESSPSGFVFPCPWSCPGSCSPRRMWRPGHPGPGSGPPPGAGGRLEDRLRRRAGARPH